ncbi:hypothetical protein [Catenulispora pinisilvae]|uniref:hypothetical protein n=1 Tax=Catenulispora pinisilvae TaxID=2705253 RepID=UPI001891822D|nr:hypothetical protein [Catenulispora pinisilvae]
MSATGSNENQNSTGPDPDGSRPDRARRPAAPGAGGFADLAGMREAILRAERGTPAGAAGAPAGPEALLDALRRSRRVDGTSAARTSAGGSSLGGAFALDAGPEPEPDGEPPLRSRSGGVNKPRAVVPTPLLAAEAVRLVDAAHSKRARMVTAIGLPAVFLAATGVAVMPTVANAASSSSSTSPTTSSCAPGSSAVPNTGGAKSSAPTSAPSSTPSSGAGKPSSAPSTPGTPQPSGGSSTPKPTSSAPQSKPSSAPSGAPKPVTPTPTGANTAPTAPPPAASSSTASSAPSSTPSPSPSVTWWNPLSWLGTTVNGVFNPAPSSSPSTVNKLAAAPAATPSSNPTSSPAPILSIGLGGSSSPSPSGTPSSKPSVPSTPQPSSSDSSKPSAPSSTPSTPTSSSSSSASSPSSVPSGVPTYEGHVLTAPTTVCMMSPAAQPFREVEWHLAASSLTLTNQKFEGFEPIQTGDGRTVTVMVIHADSIDLTDMVTYNEDGNLRVYSDGGKGQNVHLTNVTLHVLKQVGTMTAPLPLGPVTLGPPGEAGTDLISQAVMALLQLNLPLPPSTFTNVDVDQYMLTSDTLDIPGFNVNSLGIRGPLG